MIEQALRFVQDLSVKGVAISVARNSGHSQEVQIAGNEPFLQGRVPHTPHRYIYRLKDFVAYVALRSGFRSQGKKLKDAAYAAVDDVNIKVHASPYDVPSEGSVVFYRDSAVEYLESPHDQRGIRARMDLSYSDEYGLVDECEWMSQAAFYRMLKIDLDGKISTDNLLKAVAKVRFENGQVTAGNIAGTGRSTVSKEIKSEANSDVAVPDEVLIYIKPYDQLEYGAVVRVAVEVDAKKEVFKLTPYPDAMEKLREAALDTVADSLSDTGVPVFYGAAPGGIVMM